jgi:hypothetical protein
VAVSLQCGASLENLDQVDESLCYFEDYRLLDCSVSLPVLVLLLVKEPSELALGFFVIAD